MSKHYFSKLIENAIAATAAQQAKSVDVKTLTGDELAAFIDHTILKPEATRDDIITLCEEAKQYNFASVCVNPSWVQLCREQLEDSSVLICAVVGFPLGANTSDSKAIETEELVELGAREIDMVLNIGRLKDQDYTYVFEDIQQVVAAAGDAHVKVILETCLLTNDEIVAGCVLSKEAGAHFVKTSTGFNKAGATAEHVALMRRVVGPDMGVKAAGGIRTQADAQKMINAGASRIGASASVAIISA